MSTAQRPKNTAFKPQRPTVPADNATPASASGSARRPAAKPRARASGQASKNATGKGKGKAAPGRSSRGIADLEDTDEEDEEDGDGDGNSDEGDDIGDGTRAAPTDVQEEEKPAIPPKLLARLLYEGFEDKNMRIGKEAMAVVSKYIETFAREAIARAAFERQDAEAEGGMSDGFLQVSRHRDARAPSGDRSSAGVADVGWCPQQVEDLEKLAPQLLLDF